MNAVSAKTTEYELVLMLDPETSDERRAEIVGEAVKRIEAGGSLKHDRAWGMRKLAYEIRERTEADYRFFRFQGEPPLLAELDHSLKIADGVLRFRIFRVDPDSPMIEPPPPVALAGAATSRPPGGRRDASGGRERRPESEQEPAEAAAAEAPAPEAESPPESQAPAEEAEAEATGDGPEGEAALEADEPSS